MNKTLTRLVRLAGAVLLVMSLAAPALADPGTGGGSGGGGGGGGGGDGASQADVPTLAQAEAKGKAGDWAGEIDMLKEIIAAHPSADAYNLLGHAYRETGDLKRAQQYYVRALKLNPKHVGALEYQGELYVIAGETEKAKANLATIKGICGTTCEEYEDLAKALGV